MTARHLVAGVAAFGLAIGLGVATAAPASAANLGAFDACTEGTTKNIQWAPGDTIVIVYDTDVCEWKGEGYYGDVTTSRGNFDGYFCVTATLHSGRGTGSFSGRPFALITLNAGTGTTARPAVCGRGLGGALPEGAAPPSAGPAPAWVQAYGRDGADVACLDDWDASWQSWAESVTGGWVCTRSIPSLG